LSSHDVQLITNSGSMNSNSWKLSSWSRNYCREVQVRQPLGQGKHSGDILFRSWFGSAWYMDDEH